VLLQIAVVVLGLVGLIFHNNAWVVGAVIGLLIDAYSILFGRGAPHLPIAVYLVGGIVGLATGHFWWGILIAAIVSQGIEVIGTLVPVVGIALVAAPTMAYMKFITFIFPRARVALDERLLKCPGCGTEGYRECSQHPPEVFEVRGHLRGKSVLRCSHCGCGLFFSVSRGFAFGSPERIPDPMWKDMCAYWDQHHPGEKG
jgi:hypothetical protein